VADIELIISCGDLDPKYLSFLATLSSAPVIYVHGNHDKKYKHTPPEGCICIEDEIFVYKGIRILGLGGSMQYAGTEHQYTERQMAKRVQKLKRKLKKHKGFDILVTHSPAFGINDGDDLPHQGFQIFKDLMDEYAPKYFLHGHVHMQYGRKHKREDMYSQTKILNAFERCVFDYEQTSEEM
jgi:Icc-related predicted phosphoesterase